MDRIRPLELDDAEAYWNLRLEALDTEPLLFGSAAEEHRAEGFEAVTTRNLRDVPNGNFTLGAFGKERLVGPVSLVRSERVKERHLAGVVSMLMTPAARGKGLARALLKALIERAWSYEGLRTAWPFRRDPRRRRAGALPRDGLRAVRSRAADAQGWRAVRGHGDDVARLARTVVE